MIEKVCGIVLIGGRGRRFGKDKLQIILKGKKILNLLLEELACVCEEIILAGRKDVKVEVKGCNVRAVEDIVEDRGPLAGIVSGMLASSLDYFIVTPCDMPFLRKEIFQIYARELAYAEVVLSPYWGFPIGLRKKVLPDFERHLKADSLCLFDVIRSFKGKIKMLSRETVKKLGEPEIIFANINTPEDYRFALEILERGFLTP